MWIEAWERVEGGYGWGVLIRAVVLKMQVPRPGSGLPRKVREMQIQASNHTYRIRISEGVIQYIRALGSAADPDAINFEKDCITEPH